LLALILFVSVSVGQVYSPTEAKVVYQSQNPEGPFLKSISATTIVRANVTAYSSSPDETGPTPFITASGLHVADGIVANNFLPFGTKVSFPGIYGDKIFVVEDRMSNRYSTRFDIWMSSKQQALDFGIHSDALVEILE
ncbi:MAG: 3D domain-containing protein, partial [Patescibacteria group bacterium]|nr:3D domain-containing protein [Patescibacteria group bacterium]